MEPQAGRRGGLKASALQGEEEIPPRHPERVELRRADGKDPILEASLVLASQGLKHWIEFDGRDFILSVEAGDAETGRKILAQYESENLGFNPPEETGVPPLDLYLSPLIHLAIPVGVYFWADPWQPGITRRGGADAAKILAGEWWRTLTATSLHAGDEHLLGNMLSGFFILNLLRRRCGPGVSMLVLTLAAMLTNALVAALSAPEHLSIGFSTVVFAALGMLAGLETLHMPRHPLRGLRSVAPLLAALCLAVLVGIGKDIDVKAHFFGFALGAAASPLVPKLERACKPWPWQAAGVALVYALYAWCWHLALR